MLCYNINKINEMNGQQLTQQQLAQQQLAQQKQFILRLYHEFINGFMPPYTFQNIWIGLGKFGFIYNFLNARLKNDADDFVEIYEYTLNLQQVINEPAIRQIIEHDNMNQFGFMNTEDERNEFRNKCVADLNESIAKVNELVDKYADQYEEKIGYSEPILKGGRRRRRRIRKRFTYKRRKHMYKKRKSRYYRK